MKLKAIIDSPCGLRFCFENLPLSSGYSRMFLLESEMMTSEEEILAVYESVVEYASKSVPDTVPFKLHQLRDIRSTLKRIAADNILEEIELFEVKNLALLVLEIRELLCKVGIDTSLDPAIEQTLAILDPSGMKISSFYIYDSYSPALALLRREIAATSDIPKREALLDEAMSIETQIRKQLSASLKEHLKILESSLSELANIDITLAKVSLMRQMELSIPKISKTRQTLIHGMFHPMVKDALDQKGKAFQPVDISFGDLSTLIVGANMGGKTVVLKTLALNQYLFQFGFPIAAKSAEMMIQQDIYLVLGDGQNELRNLSSFAAEMERIDCIIKASSRSEDIMALIDEPARSTNPIEGTALVMALIDILDKKNVTLVITTHYNIIGDHFRRLRVKGLEDRQMNYSLCESPLSEVPHEALNIAESLGISPEWIAGAKKILTDK